MHFCIHQDHWTILSETSKELLTEYWRSYPVKRQYVFVASKGKGERKPFNSSGVEIMLRKVSASAGLERVTPHTLRHSFATHMVEQGESLEFIQTMMGHRDPASTHKYIHAANKALTELSSDKKYLGARIGYICVLHTWGSRMNYHPHLHIIVLGGGLDEKNHWQNKNGKLFSLLRLSLQNNTQKKFIKKCDIYTATCVIIVKGLSNTARRTAWKRTDTGR